MLLDRDARIERMAGRVLKHQARTAKKDGNELLCGKCEKILSDELMFGLFVEEYRIAAGIDEKPEYYLGIVDELMKLLNWFIENGDLFIALIEKIVQLFLSFDDVPEVSQSAIPMTDDPELSGLGLRDILSLLRNFPEIVEQFHDLVHQLDEILERLLNKE